MATRRTRRHFDLEAAARRLFLTAQAKQDFSGAAALLRLLRDLRTSDDAEPKAKDEWVPLATDEEFQELAGLLDAIDALALRVKQRLHLAPAPAPIAPINVVAPLIVEPAPLPFDLFPNEIIRDGNVIEIDDETGDETLVGSIEAVAAEGREEDDDASA